MKVLLVAACALLQAADALQRPSSPLLSSLKAAPIAKTPEAKTPEAWKGLNVAAVGALATAGVPLSAVAEVPGWVGPAISYLDPTLFFIQFIMLLRVIISWYPETDLEEMPWKLVVAPTEPILSLTRAVVPPSFGVDISPIVWIAVASFSRELLLGQQGVLILMQQRG